MMRLHLGRHAMRVTSIRGASVLSPTRPGHTTRLATEVELARLCGRNLADIEAETRASAQLATELRDGADGDAADAPSVPNRDGGRPHGR